ncbi:MAG: hypothetical protein WA152_03210 [Microgenomates group bacterium]
MQNKFFIEETWAGYKKLNIENKNIAFIYGWEEIEQEYLKKVVEKYPETFVLEVVDNNTSLLKLKIFDGLKIKTLLDVVDDSKSEWFELIDLETGKLLNSEMLGQESENLDLF